MLATSHAHADCAPSQAVTAEVQRLLDVAAIHASKSGLCYDGSGTRYSIDQLQVCFAPQTLIADASYRVTGTHEADTRGCRDEGGCVTPSEHKRGKQRITFRRAGDAVVIEIPKQVSGLKLLTPLERAHKGDCIVGPAFKPKPITP